MPFLFFLRRNPTVKIEFLSTLKLKVCLGFLLIFILFQSAFSQPISTAPPKIKLAVIIVFDQFRADYLTRFSPQYLPASLPQKKVGGFKYLMEQGANFIDCRFDHYPLYTAPGHAIVVTGGEPYKTLIVGNEWYDENQQKKVYAVSDPKFGLSPRNLGSTTLGDELKLSTEQKSKVVSISLKDRAAILLGGFTADEVFWFDSNHWVTSDFYGKHIPAWAEKVNDGLGKTKEDLVSPRGNELTWNMAMEAVKNEKLGNHDVPDLLTINFASNDYVGHVYGPDSQEVKRMSIASDRGLSAFLNFLNVSVPGGLKSILLVVTADHGIGSLPEYLNSIRIPSERLDPQMTIKTVEDRLTLRFGEGPWVSSFIPPFMYLNPKTISHYSIEEATVEQEAVDALSEEPSILAAYGRTQIMKGALPRNEVSLSIEKSFVPLRSGELVIVPGANVIWSSPKSKEAVHESLYTYDTHVPLLLYGAGIKPGTYTEPVKPIDIAPTVAYLLKTQFPSACEGKILTEAIH